MFSFKLCSCVKDRSKRRMREVSLFSPFLSLITRERKEEKLSQSLSRLPPFDEIYRRVRGFISLTSRTSERERDIHCKPLES